MELKLTKRMKRILAIIEDEVTNSHEHVITPIHLLIGCLREKTGVLGEINLRCQLDISKLRKCKLGFNHSLSYNLFQHLVTTEVKEIFEMAIGYMNRYNQVYLNEGHLLKAMLNSNQFKHLISDTDQELVRKLATTSRDMITHLNEIQFEEIHSSTIRKVNPTIDTTLPSFIETNFSSEWANTIQQGIENGLDSIYVAVDELGHYIGFAGYDLYNHKKCVFGPMGVVKTARVKGIGKMLLHACLKEMRLTGYEYAIISEAGPIEFYETACNAVLIPIS